MEESKLYSYCLQGDVTHAYEYLQSFPNKSNDNQKLAEKFYNRFFSGKPEYVFNTEDPWIKKVLLSYYQYFVTVLTGKGEEEAEKRLIMSLRECIPVNTDNIDKIEEYLEKIFHEKGYQFLGGVTAPFRGPYIWKTSVRKEFSVELPYGSQKVIVYFLSDFIMQGWAHFATFGKKFARGWAKSDGLYYVMEDSKEVNLDSSEFQVSYLKHEAQHFADYSAFHMLEVKDLEYRAKLVELIYETHSQRLLNRFYYEQKNDPKHPHPYSSFVIMNRLTLLVFGEKIINEFAPWKTVDSTVIQNYARSLYDEHTELLNGNGGKGVI